MTPAKATIGVLGGMGPEATILFMQKMVAAVQADDDADHVPLIVHNNTQVPSRIKMLINGDGADPAPVLAEMARGLEQAGAEALAMPCNTAHVCAPVIVGAVSVPFLDMVELAAGKARDMAGSGARVGLLGSPALEQTGVFRQPLQRAGLTPVHGADGERRLEVIRSVKMRGVSPPAIEALQASADHLAERGADVVMVCCTEFSLMAPDLRTDRPLFDTLDALVAACVAYAAGHSPSDEAARGSNAASEQTKTDRQGKEQLQC